MGVGASTRQWVPPEDDTGRPRSQHVPCALVHVGQRCHDRRFLLRGPGDKDAYAQALRETAERTGYGVVSWCVQDNHVHLLLRTPPRIRGRTLRCSPLSRQKMGKVKLHSSSRPNEGGLNKKGKSRWGQGPIWIYSFPPAGPPGAGGGAGAPLRDFCKIVHFPDFANQ